MLLRRDIASLCVLYISRVIFATAFMRQGRQSPEPESVLRLEIDRVRHDPA